MSFPDRANERFLAVDIDALLQGPKRHRKVHMIRNCNRDRIDFIAHLIEHLSIVLIARYIRVLLVVSRGTRIVNVAKRYEILRSIPIDVSCATTTAADLHYVQFAVRRGRFPNYPIGKIIKPAAVAPPLTKFLLFIFQVCLRD